MLPYVQDYDLDYQEIGAEELARGSGQFRVKKTSFERTVSKLIFLGQNMLVRPHGVHQGQF